MNSGLCLGADAFVAIDAAQLVDPFDAADQQPLQVQLQGDPQEQVDIERVVMRRERPGRRSAGDRVQRGAFDLAETSAASVLRIDCTILVRSRNRRSTPSP